MANHIVALYAATAGQSGSALGSDEEDVVLLEYIIWEVATRKIVTEQQYIVSGCGEASDNFLSEQCRDEYELSEEHVRAGQPLESAIDSFEAIFSKLSGDGNTVHLVTDGQLHLRQVLHPKCTSKGIHLSQFYDSFFDIRKEFKSFYHNAPEIHSIADMLEHSGIAQDTSANIAVKTCREMTHIMDRMVADGHRFAIPEIIHNRLEPGICTRSEEVDSSCVVRARGLPWQSSDQDIAKFFRGLNICKGGVALCLSLQGRRNGEALVRFVCPEHRDMALKRHKHHIGNRYIEVYKATGEDFINVAGGNNNEAQQFLSRGGNVIVRMRGLPYDCNAKQVVEFFVAGEKGRHILDGEEGVLFVRKPDGRATGDAFVLFATDDEAQDALCKHREIIGSRYIELFRSTTAEVQQVLNRSMDPRSFEPQQPLISQLPQLPLMPQQFVTAGSKRDCIRLRGLPYEAQVEHVLEFLGDHAKSIAFRGVHMVINTQGQPSGEAFIQMETEHAAMMAAQHRHHRYMVFGKKQRYIEVFQCSGDDMSGVIGGCVQTPRAVVSPGMLMWDQNGLGAAVAHGSGPPNFPPSAIRQSFPGPATLPLFPQALSQTINGSQMAGLQPMQIKQESILSSQILPPHLRHPFIHPSSLELPNMSQHQSIAYQSVKPGVQNPVSAAAAAAMIPQMLNQYADFALPGTSLANPGLMLLPGAKMPTALYPHYPPSMQLLAVSSAADFKNPSFQPKYTASPFLPMQYAPAQTMSLPRSHVPDQLTKRSYENAFSADKNHPYRQAKRSHRATTPGALGHGGLALPGMTSPHLASVSIPGQVNAVGQQHAVGAMSVPPPSMIPALYPSPQLYPSL